MIGIALDDAQSVRNFVETYGISYPILVGSEDVFATSAAYGNEEGVLPYSVLIDKDRGGPLAICGHHPTR